MPNEKAPLDSVKGKEGGAGDVINYAKEKEEKEEEENIEIKRKMRKILVSVKNSF